jgi:hypothetical protein
MRIIPAFGAVAVLFVLVLSGCPLGGVVIVAGTLTADYYSIASDVTVTISQGDEKSWSVPVPVAGTYNQIGSYLFANVPSGVYAVEVSFEANQGFMPGTMYRVDGGAWLPVDDETVTGTGVPYTFSIAINSLAAEAGVTLDLYFGDAE